MPAALVVLLGSLLQCAAVTPTELSTFFASSKGLSMPSSDAAKLANQEAPKLTQCGITVPQLQALRDVMYSPSKLDLSITSIRSNLLPVAYQKVNPDDLAEMYRTLYATDSIDMQKSDAQSRSIELVKKQVDAATLKSLFSALYATSGVDLPKKDAQAQALELSLSGANSTQLKIAYQGFKHMGKPTQDALQAAIPESILAGFHGLARRHAQDTVPYTAAEFQQYFGSSWVSKWATAPQEERVANDHHAYDVADFDKYYTDPWYWTQAKTATQKRLAEDGKAYTMKEFSDYYGSTWQQSWMTGPVLPCAECASASESLIINV
eukprot:gnl/MRDRNA2_/MRDRNA2_75837_c0_seq1.p1 gnl/MRDRNA2_/MRDRNA2_75837_c0~~gnl/MRDRNA2_/MRDRNA2_75837_c0_seq1.p1  ORF type:complete len:357 (+),score=80.16 gnl/MRDRNA2_/MRDRNA2_75837_c0_seq1:106-1071(+)